MINRSERELLTSSLRGLAELNAVAAANVLTTARSLNVRLSFDHRIFDGALAGRALSRLDQVLNSSILDELRELARLEACTAHGRDVSSIPGHDARPCRPGD